MNLEEFCKLYETDKVDLIAGGRFHEDVYNRFCGMDNIKQEYDIKWEKMPSLPNCIQECATGIVADHLVYTCGYCAGLVNGGRKTAKGRRGFLSNTYGYDLNGGRGWKNLPPFPGQGRQGMRAVVVDNEMYCWGGWTYKPMKAKQINNIPPGQWPPKKGVATFSDGWKLRLNREAVWEWKPLPALPFPMTNYGICSKGRKIFISTGGHVLKAQMDTTEEFNHIYCLDLDDVDKGWIRLAKMPGSVRIDSVMACVGDWIYILGGMYPNGNWRYEKTGNVSRFYTVIDQWRYSITEDRWERIIDNLAENGNWSCVDQVVFDNRWILFGGGSLMPESVDNDKIVTSSIKPCGCRSSHCAHGNSFLDRMYAYDTQTGEMMKSRTNLPGLINLPSIKVWKDKICIIAGESYSFVWENEHFPRPHLDIFGIGQLVFDI